MQNFYPFATPTSSRVRLTQRCEAPYCRCVTELRRHQVARANKMLCPLLVAGSRDSRWQNADQHHDSLVIPMEYKELTKHVLDSFLLPNHAVRKRRRCASLCAKKK